MKGLKFFACRDSVNLGRKVARLLGKRLGRLHLSNFADGEIRVWVEEKVKGKNCLVFQTTRLDPNNRLIELCLVASALKESGAKKVSAIIPSFGYARQFMAYQPGETKATLLMAKILVASGVDEVMVIDLHHEKILDLFGIPAVNLKTEDLFVQAIKNLDLKDFILVAPDKGSKPRAASLAGKLNAPYVFLKKKRKTKGFGREDWSRVFDLSGKVRGLDAVIVDDEISSGGTVVKTASLLKERGAKRIFVLVTHPVFSGQTYLNLTQAPLEKILVTDTLPLGKKAFKALPNLEVVSVAGLLAWAIEKKSKD